MPVKSHPLRGYPAPRITTLRVRHSPPRYITMLPGGLLCGTVLARSRSGHFAPIDVGPAHPLSYTGPSWSELVETMATVNENTLSRRYMGPVIFSSTVGTAIEWYDFFLYGTMAALVFPQVFFTESVPLVGTLLALFTFLVGFVARPFGGALFGHLGDRIGRKSTLIATLLLMGLSTLIIGFLPGYATLGVAAPLILVLLRLGQGLGVGGEWGGSVLLALEYGHRRHRGFWASWPQMGVPVG